MAEQEYLYKIYQIEFENLMIWVDPIILVFPFYPRAVSNGSWCYLERIFVLFRKLNFWDFSFIDEVKENPTTHHKKLTGIVIRRVTLLFGVILRLSMIKFN